MIAAFLWVFHLKLRFFTFAQMLYQIMVKEEGFLQAYRNIPTLHQRVITAPIDQLLLRERFIIVSIAKCIGYNHRLEVNTIHPLRFGGESGIALVT